MLRSYVQTDGFWGIVNQNNRKEYMKIADTEFYIGISTNKEVKPENTAESLATFICDAGNSGDLRIITPNGNEILNTFGIFINRCADMEFLEELKKVLIPMQKKLEGELGLPECVCH